MKPIKTELTNDVLRPPAGAEDSVVPLPVTRYRNEHGDQVSSCWKMDWNERLRCLFTGRVWFDCWGSVHPPIRLRVAGGRNS